MKRLLGAALPLLLTAAMCPATDKPSDYCNTMLENYCAFAYQCCNGAERQHLLFFAYARTEGDCKEKLPKLFCGYYASQDEAVAEGRGEWNSNKAVHCSDRASQAIAACDYEMFNAAMGSGDDEACEWQGALFTGLVEDGDTCYDDAECKGDQSECRQESGGDTSVVTAKGTCEGPPIDGEPCDDYGGCADGHYCDNDDTCRELKPNGSECTSGYECESEYCDYQTTGYECTAKLDIGEDCTWHEDCESGHCSSATSQCAAKLANGEDCDYSDNCESDYCDYNSGQCAADPYTDTSDNIDYDICDGE